MKPLRKLNRRSFLASVAGSGFVLVAGAATAQNAQRASPHDSDCGANADRAAGGSGKPTDRDTGPNADPPCRGRGRRRPQTGCSDADTGRNADHANEGRTCRPPAQ